MLQALRQIWQKTQLYKSMTIHKSPRLWYWTWLTILWVPHSTCKRACHKMGSSSTSHKQGCCSYWLTVQFRSVKKDKVCWVHALFLMSMQEHSIPCASHRVKFSDCVLVAPGGAFPGMGQAMNQLFSFKITAEGVIDNHRKRTETKTCFTTTSFHY